MAALIHILFSSILIITFFTRLQKPRDLEPWHCIILLCLHTRGVAILDNSLRIKLKSTMLLGRRLQDFASALISTLDQPPKAHLTRHTLLRWDSCNIPRTLERKAHYQMNLLLRITIRQISPESCFSKSSIFSANYSNQSKTLISTGLKFAPLKCNEKYLIQ